MKYKTIISACIFTFSILYSSALLANPSIYLNAMDLMTHGMKNNKLHIKVSVELPINHSMDFGMSGAYAQATEESKKDLNSLGLYIDYKFHEKEGNAIKSESWFIRNYIGIVNTNEDTSMNYISNTSMHASAATNSNAPNNLAKDGHGRSWFWGDDNRRIDTGYANTVRRPDNSTNTLVAHDVISCPSATCSSLSSLSIVDSRYIPEYGVYIGKKYVLNNNLSVKLGIGVSTALKIAKGSYLRIGRSDFIIDSFLNVGYSF